MTSIFAQTLKTACPLFQYLPRFQRPGRFAAARSRVLGVQEAVAQHYALRLSFSRRKWLWQRGSVRGIWTSQLGIIGPFGVISRVNVVT